MAYGPISRFYGSIASGASTSGEINLARAWKTVWLQTSSMSTAVNLNVHAAAASGASYFKVYHPAINSSTVAVNSFVISAGVADACGLVPLPNGFQHIKLIGTGVISGGASFSIICSD